MILEILYTNLKNPAVDRKIKAAVTESGRNWRLSSQIGWKIDVFLVVFLLESWSLTYKMDGIYIIGVYFQLF